MIKKLKKLLLKTIVRLVNKYEHLAPNESERNELIADKNRAIQELRKMDGEN